MQIHPRHVYAVLAPGFEPDALEVFKRKKNLRVLGVGEFGTRKSKLEVRNVDGGLLVQDVDTKILTEDDFTVVTENNPHQKMSRLPCLPGRCFAMQNPMGFSLQKTTQP